MAEGNGSSAWLGFKMALVKRAPTTHWFESVSLGRLKAALIEVPFAECMRCMIG